MYPAAFPACHRMKALCIYFTRGLHQPISIHNLEQLWCCALSFTQKAPDSVSAGFPGSCKIFAWIGKGGFPDF